ncbi:MAG: hypothetical protein N2561_00230 [Bacteroidetes bacterium]|nr:hypothetical protein [Rhodothermia bacterium]MCX7905953.1 hypothetical protein [Bacteroidota bacterium]MDW8138080.1 hypothetical protein [Bacteroidota bacterium]MDW8285764.1 hypothetical protein [Bacteroidota bacterium]
MRRCLCLLGLLLVGLPLRGQDRTPLAWVGSEAIDRQTFWERYEQSLWIGRERGRLQDVPKHGFLLALIAERLLAQEGAQMKLDQAPPVRTLLDEIERMLLLDALYRVEIGEPVQVAAREIEEAAWRRLQPVHFAYVVLASSEQAEAARASLLRASDPIAAFDSLQRALGQEGQRRIGRWGDFYEPIERQLYEELKPSEVGRPIEVEGRFYLLQLRERQRRPFVLPADLEQARYETARILRMRRERDRFYAFLSAFGQGKTAQVSQELFERLCRAITERLAIRAEKAPPGRPLRLLAADWAALRAALQDALPEPFIEAPSWRRSLGYVLDRLAHRSFAVVRLGPTVAHRLRGVLWELIAEEFLLEEVRARGLEQRPELRRDLELWRTAYLAWRRQRLFADSLRQAWSDLAYGVRLVRWEAASEQAARSLRSELERGLIVPADTTEELAPLLAEPLRALVVSSEIEQILGPFPERGQWAFYRVLARRKLKPEELEKAVERALQAHIAHLARQAGVRIDLRALEETPVRTAHNLLAVRLLGFGFRLLSAPPVYPLLEWYDLMDRARLYAARLLPAAQEEEQ